MNKEVLVDIDDTIAQTQKAVIKKINQTLGRNLKLSLFTFEFRENLSPSMEDIVNVFFNDKEAVLAVEPYPSASRGLRILHGAGFGVHIVSSRKSPTSYFTREWLEFHGFIPYVAEIHPRDRTLTGSEFKLSVVEKTGAEAAFDDQVRIAKTLAQKGLRVYLITRPWNSELKRFPNILRVRSFNEAAQIHAKNIR